MSKNSCAPFFQAGEERSERCQDSNTSAVKGKRDPTPRLQPQMELIGQLPRAKQKFLMEMLDTAIQQQAS